MSPAPADYVDVAERIREFKERYPEGSLQSVGVPWLMDAGDKKFIVYSAAAYRTPDDPRPGIGWAWEPVPGPTPFTRDSELMNAETSAWGRAIVALGFETKKIASADEVRNRQQAPETPQASTPGPATGSTPITQTEAYGRYEEAFKEAVKNYPDGIGGESWPKFCQRVSQEKFGKSSGGQLTEAEFEELASALQEAALPFG